MKVGDEETTDITDRIKTTCQSVLLRNAAVLDEFRVQYNAAGRDGRCELTHTKRINNENKRLLLLSELIFSRCTHGQTEVLNILKLF